MREKTSDIVGSFCFRIGPMMHDRSATMSATSPLQATLGLLGSSLQPRFPSPPLGKDPRVARVGGSGLRGP